MPLNGPDSEWDWGERDVGYADDLVTDWAVNQLGAMPGPFFLGVGLIAPHVPWYAPSQFWPGDIPLPAVLENDLDDVPGAGQALTTRTGMLHEWVIENGKWAEAYQAYLACIAHLDYNLGRLLDGLDNSPHADNTIIVFVSDNGMTTGQKGHWSKYTLWRESVQIPLIVTGMGQPGRVYDKPVAALDIFPTLTELCGLPAMPGVEGNVLTGGEDREITCVCDGHTARIDESWWQIEYADGGRELYNNAQDPLQWDNLAGEGVWLPLVEG